MPYSRFEYTWLLSQIFNPQKTALLKPVSSKQSNLVRPTDCTLDSTKARELSGIYPRSVSEVIKQKAFCQLSRKGIPYVQPQITHL